MEEAICDKDPDRKLQIRGEDISVMVEEQTYRKKRLYRKMQIQNKGKKIVLKEGGRQNGLMLPEVICIRHSCREHMSFVWKK